MRTALPWILLALVAGGWIGATVFSSETSVSPGVVAAPSADPSAVAELRAAVETLRAEVQSLREERPQPGPTLKTSGTTPTERPKAAPRTAEYKARESKQRRQEAANAQRKTWYDAIRSLKAGDARETALAEMRAAFDSDDDTLRLAALQLSRWLGNIEYDRAAWRAAILPHTKSADGATQAAALVALAYVQPDESDLALWPEAAKRADRSTAEGMAHAIVRTAEGVLQGDAADAVLHLLRDGTDIRKAFVVRGLQSVKQWDPVVEARLVEIVGAAPASSYDSSYFFHFITPRMDPKSDAIVDLMLAKIEEGKSNIQTLIRGFHDGLDERQKAHAADKLVGYAENANAYTVRYIAEALGHVASARHVDRMAALIAGDDVDKYAKNAMEHAIQRAKRRP